MIEDNYFNNNNDFAKVCENLFYGSTNFAGNIGIKILAEVCGMSEENFNCLFPDKVEDKELIQ